MPPTCGRSIGPNRPNLTNLPNLPLPLPLPLWPRTCPGEDAPTDPHALLHLEWRQWLSPPLSLRGGAPVAFYVLFPPWPGSPQCSRLSRKLSGPCSPGPCSGRAPTPAVAVEVCFVSDCLLINPAILLLPPTLEPPWTFLPLPPYSNHILPDSRLRRRLV